MQNPRVGVGLVAVVQIPQNRFQDHVSCVQPFAHIPTRTEPVVPVCGIVVIWGSLDVRPLSPRGHLLVKSCPVVGSFFRVRGWIT